MGKFLGIIQYSGKLGNTVGMRKGPGQKFNNVRAMADVVTNPRTNAQIMQRMKCLTCANFYSAFKGVLNHAFQGVKYGAPCQSEFLRLNMRLNATMPIAKGTKAVVPAPVYVSTGSIPPINFTVSDTGVSISCSSITTRDWGHVSAAIIEANPYLHNGDQLTVLQICSDDIAGIEDGSAIVIAEYKRFVLNTSSTDSVPTIITYGSGNCSFGVFGSEFVVGGAIIVSRPSVFRTKVTWQRSTQFFVLTTDTNEYLNQDAIINECMNSFKSTETVNLNSDWYLNGGTTSSTSSGSSDEEGGPHGAQPGGQLATVSDGGLTNVLVYKSNGQNYLVCDNTSSPTKLYRVAYIVSNTEVEIEDYPNGTAPTGNITIASRIPKSTLQSSFGVVFREAVERP